MTLETRKSRPAAASAFRPSENAQAVPKVRIDNLVAGVGTIASPRISINMTNEGSFRIDCRVPGGRWVNIPSEKIIRGELPTS